MQIEPEVLKELKINANQVEKVETKLVMLQEIYNSQVALDQLKNQQSAIVKKILDKEKKTINDILDINLDKGEITFKEGKDAEPKRPDNETVSNESD